MRKMRKGHPKGVGKGAKKECPSGSKLKNIPTKKLKPDGVHHVVLHYCSKTEK